MLFQCLCGLEPVCHFTQADDEPQFLAFAKDSAGMERKVLILYAPKTTIDSDGIFENNSESECLELFEKACKTNDIIFVNMEEEFKELYESRHILTHGFSNTRIGSGHLNAYGHKVIAEKLAVVLMSDR